MRATPQRDTEGFGLIEIVIVTAVVTVTLFAFLQTEILALRLLRSEKENLELSFLAQEAMEAVRAVRDESWTSISSLSNGVPYYPVVENGKWKLATANPGLLNGKYGRDIQLAEVHRDASGRISASGVADSDTRKVTARATTSAKTVELVTYVTNFQASLGVPEEAKVVSFEDATTDANLANFPSPNAGNGDPAQGFTAPAAAPKVTKVELFLRRVTSAPSDVFVELRPSPTGAILGTSQIITASTIASTSASWVSFRFSEPVTLSASTKYYIRLRSVPTSTDAGSGSAGTIHWGYKQSPPAAGPGPYSGGEARRYIGQLANPSNTGESLDDKDFGFKVYAQQ